MDLIRKLSQRSQDMQPLDPPMFLYISPSLLDHYLPLCSAHRLFLQNLSAILCIGLFLYILHTAFLLQLIYLDFKLNLPISFQLFLE